MVNIILSWSYSNGQGVFLSYLITSEKTRSYIVEPKLLPQKSRRERGDFAESKVVVAAEWDASRVQIRISDDGPGFSHEVLSRIGEPYVTSRGVKRGQGNEGDFGLGLGFFIAKTLLERSGASLQLTNRPPPDHGATVVITWPRAAMDLGDLSEDAATGGN